MCGVAAIFSMAAPVSSAALRAAARALEHRGPDEQGCWVAPHGRVGLAHTRLRIIDPISGSQPIASEDERLRIAVNGEFYGFEAVRRELEAKGHRFRTHSDSEIALHLYEEYGSACLEQLRGEFAFVLWDEAKQTLFAARDRFGIKPLFYAQSGDVLYLASEAKALFAAGVTPAWDDEAVFQSLYLCMPADRSLYRGVRQVPAGHFLVATRGALHLQSYWDAEYPVAGSAAERISLDACVEETRRLLDEAVRIRMRADVPVGCLLSGGLDSSAVLSIARSYAERPMKAFTVAFADPAYDESDRARQAAEHAGVELVTVAAGDSELADHFCDSVAQAETLQYNAHGTARFLLSRAVKQAGYKAVLGGEGADELFAGYGFCRPAILSGRSSRGFAGKIQALLKLVRPLKRTEMPIARTSPWLARRLRLVELPHPVLTELADRLEALRFLLAGDFAARLAARDPFRTFFEHFPGRSKLRGREPAKQILYVWLKSIFVNYHLAADRVDMAHGVEVRLPFLDHLLFDYVRRIPVPILAAGGQQKYLLREAMRPHLPESIRSRAKQPFLAPPLLGSGSRLDQLVQDLLRSETMRTLPFFEPRAVAALLDRLSSSDEPTLASLDPVFLMLASLGVLQDRYRL